MTAIRKEKKSLFYLIAIAIMVAIMGISCSESPTDPANLSEDGGGIGTGSGGSGASSGYNVDVVYPEVKDTLLSQGIDVTKAQESQLDTIWKALANENLLVTSEYVDSVNSAASAKNKNYFYFDSKGDMVYGPSPYANQSDKGKAIKVFQKAVLVKVNGGYTIGGLYKVANIDNIGSIKQNKDTVIRHQKIGFNTTVGNFEVVYIDTQTKYKDGYAYILMGNDTESTVDKTKDDFGIIVDNSILKQTLNGINNTKSQYKARFYR